MLSEEKKSFREDSEWRRVKHVFHRDARYHAVDSSSQKEDWFREYLKLLNRVSYCIVGNIGGGKIWHICKNCILASLNLADLAQWSSYVDRTCVFGGFKFGGLLKTAKSTNISNLPIFPLYVHGISIDLCAVVTLCVFQNEKQDRIEASLKEREREVAMSRTAQAREWDKERDQLRKAEAQDGFKALLVDMVSSFQHLILQISN